MWLVIKKMDWHWCKAQVEEILTGSKGKLQINQSTSMTYWQFLKQIYIGFTLCGRDKDMPKDRATRTTGVFQKFSIFKEGRLG